MPGQPDSRTTQGGPPGGHQTPTTSDAPATHVRHETHLYIVYSVMHNMDLVNPIGRRAPVFSFFETSASSFLRTTRGDQPQLLPGRIGDSFLS
jgi:hypothetical protein